jgi:hypothetical protein
MPTKHGAWFQAFGAALRRVSEVVAAGEGHGVAVIDN